MAQPADRPRFLEYRLGAVAVALRAIADALVTVSLASAATFLLALLPLVGIVDESAFGYRDKEAVDDWSRAWLGIAIGGGLLGVGLFAVLFLGAADVAARARLRRESGAPGAERLVPVQEQRKSLTRDPWKPLNVVSGNLALLVGLFFLILAAYSVFGSDNSDDRSSALVATAFLGGGTAGLFVVWLLTRRHRDADPPTVRAWIQESAVTAASLARGARNSTRREQPTAVDRAVRMLAGPGRRALVVASLCWAAVGFVLVFIRKPGRLASPNHFSEPIENGIDATWRVVVVVGLALFVVAVVGWVVLLALDLVRLLSLSRQARRGDTDSRPCTQALRRTLHVPGAAGRLGRSLVVLATVVGSGALSALAVDRGPAGLASTCLQLAAASGVAGVVATAAAFGWLAGARNAVRAAWPVTDGPADPGGSTKRRPVRLTKSDD